MLALEVLLYLEDRYGPGLPSGTVLTALSTAVVEVLAATLRPGRNPPETVDVIADWLKVQLVDRLANPQPMTRARFSTRTRQRKLGGRGGIESRA
jgi:hypothetical protein